MGAETKVVASPLAKLREPFPDNQISKLPKPTKSQTEAVRDDFKKGVRCKVCDSWHHPDVIHLDYVGHAALTDRLLDTDLEWSWEPMSYGQDGLPALDKVGGLWIKLTVCGVTRPGYGSADGKSGGDAMKEIIGDALRNAAMRFGAALDLWHKGDLHADEADQGQSQTGAVSPDQPAEMPDFEWAKLVQLCEAANADTTAMLKHYGVKNLRHLKLDQYEHAVGKLNAKLAEMAKAETNAKAQQTDGEFAELDADSIPY